MVEFEQKLAELENAIIDAEKAVQHDAAVMPKGKKKGLVGNVMNYFYIAAGVIPILVGVILYFVKPKFIMRKRKGKSVVCVRSLIQWVLIISFVAWVALFAGAYFGGFLKN